LVLGELLLDTVQDGGHSVQTLLLQRRLQGFAGGQGAVATLMHRLELLGLALETRWASF
jgi:hypothetical protein